jgi:L-2-hydroxyglutarate oxidase
MKREGYQMSNISIRDLWTYGTYLGFWRMALKYWRTAIPEVYRSLNKRAFVKALQGLLPELKEEDVFRSGSGVRAQALDPAGKLVDDFRIVEADHMVHVLNAPSPAATASLSIGATIAEMAAKNFDLP